LILGLVDTFPTAKLMLCPKREMHLRNSQVCEEMLSVALLLVKLFGTAAL